MIAWRSSLGLLAAGCAFLAPHSALFSAQALSHEVSDSPSHSDPYSYILKSSFSLPPSLAEEWQVQEHLPPRDYLMDLRFSFRPRPENIRFLEGVLFSNHPSDPLWTRRKHLSKDEVARLAAPHRDSVERFRKFLARNDIDSNALVYSKEDVAHSIAILPTVSVQLAERLLGTRYRVYKNTKTGREVVRATEYSLPADIYEDIDWVQPTNYFGKVTAYRKTSHVEPPSPVRDNELNINAVTAADNVTLSLLKELYNFANFTPSSTSTQNVLGIAGYVLHERITLSSAPRIGFVGT